MMKDYIIWLDSGECITGTVTDEIAGYILEIWNNASAKRIDFEDTQGHASVKKDKIEAIAINNIVETNKIGF